MGIMSPITGRLFDKFGAKWLAVTGLGLMAMTVGNFAFITLETPYFVIMILNTLFMLGISMLMMPVMTNALNQLPRPLYPHGTAIISTLQQVSGAIGTALLIAVMSTGTERFLQKASGGMASDPNLYNHAMTAGVKTAFLMAFGLIIIAWIIAFRIKRAVLESEVVAGLDNEGIV